MVLNTRAINFVDFNEFYFARWNDFQKQLLPELLETFCVHNWLIAASFAREQFPSTAYSIAGDDDEIMAMKRLAQREAAKRGIELQNNDLKKELHRMISNPSVVNKFPQNPRNLPQIVDCEVKIGDFSPKNKENGGRHREKQGKIRKKNVFICGSFWVH